MTDHRDLASAARQAYVVLASVVGHVDASYTPPALEALTVLRAALSAEPVFRGSVSEVEDWAGDFDRSGDDDNRQLVVYEVALPADTPEPPQPCDECEETGENRLAHRSVPPYAQATPEGGQPTDDELLARHEDLVAAGTATLLESDLASALLRWRENYDRVLAQSRTRSQALGRLERELAEARSRGEVLAVLHTRRSTVPGESPLPGAYVPAEPGTEVLVVRADQETGP